jgi:hypothetical protein
MLDAFDSEILEPMRPLAVHEYWCPDGLRLNDGQLFWEPIGPSIGRPRRVKPMVETFLDFLDLASTDDDRDVLRYAKRWGVLNLCKAHLEPVSHDPRCIPLVSFGVNRGEPVSEWRRFSRNAGALVRISGDLYEGKPGSESDWEILRSDEKLFESHFQRIRRTQDAMANKKSIVVEIVNSWLKAGDVRPTMTWTLAPGVILASRGTSPFSGLFAALAVQILENGGRFVIASCSGCNRFFDATAKHGSNDRKEGRQRRPKRGQARYCGECFDSGIPVVLAKRRQALGISKPRNTRKRGK